MNHDRRHGSYGRAQRAEDIGHNLAETGHLHDEDFVEDLRAVPSEAWAQGFCLIRSYISTAWQDWLPERDLDWFTFDAVAQKGALRMNFGGRANHFRWPLTPFHVRDR